jgi:hypothetical protein
MSNGFWFPYQKAQSILFMGFISLGKIKMGAGNKSVPDTWFNSKDQIAGIGFIVVAFQTSALNISKPDKAIWLYMMQTSIP